MGSDWTDLNEYNSQILIHLDSLWEKLMRIAFNDEQLELRDKIRGYLKELMTPALRQELDRDPTAGAEGGGPEFRKALRQMGADGWIGMGWPEALGGTGVTPLEQYIFTEEVLRVRFPYPFLTTDGIGPVLAEHGNEELKDTVVKDIRAGKVVFAIGYSEPNAGTDLASLRTRAERDGDEWVINGQKIWTSLANIADYVWLAARTDPDPRLRHKGLTLFVVPVSSEGFSLTPIHTLGWVRTNATYFQDVRVPHKNVVGEVGGGWKLITSQLNLERLALVNVGYHSEIIDAVARWAAGTRLPDGRRVIDQGWVRQNLAKCHTGLEALKLVCWKQAWAMTEEKVAMADASAAKVFGSELFIEQARLLQEILGLAGTLVGDTAGAVLQGRVERLYRSASILTFGGGTNEVQRDIIAAAGLMMPRSRRA